jgi:hypothetical protein
MPQIKAPQYTTMSTNREAEILYSLVETRYGDKVTLEEREEIRKSLDAILETVEALRAIKLENGDEPYQFFKPYWGKQ